MRNYIACTCMGAHLLGITHVGDTAYCVWLIVFTSDCCVGSSAPMVVHVLDCRRGLEHLTGCKWRNAGVYSMLFTTVLFTMYYSCFTDF